MGEVIRQEVIEKGVNSFIFEEVDFQEIGILTYLYL